MLPTDLEASAIEALVSSALNAIENAKNLQELKEVKQLHVGEKSPIALANRQIAGLSSEHKAEVGARVGNARQAINSAFANREVALEREALDQALEAERVDVTEALFTSLPGARHPISMITERVIDVFTAMGWEIKEGPELEAEWLNFDALNLSLIHI